VGQAGGVFCILSEDEMLFAGPPNQKQAEDQIRIANVGSKEAIASFGGTNRILVAGDNTWLSVDGKLKLLDRRSYVEAQGVIDQAKSHIKNQSKPAAKMRAAIEAALKKQQSAWKWSVDSPTPLEMIKAGDSILVGLAGEARAYSASDGREQWRAPIDGAAHGLAVAAGQLYVCTDRGQIYAFGPAK
jgi:hypothetical protein